MRHYYTHTCLQCGTAFESRFKDAKYCSPECYSVSRREACLLRFNNIDGFYLVNYSSKDEVTVACSMCGTEYTTTSTQALRKQRCQFCSEQKKKEKMEQLWMTRQAREDSRRKKDEHLKKLREQKNVEREKMHQEALKRQKERLRAYWKGHELDRENRIKSNGRRDRDITLQKLYSRDGGRCHICGGICDFSDGTWTDKGYFIARASYPSIDHIVPLSLGGTHTWDNIKLAHFRCNALRGNAPLRKEGA